MRTLLATACLLIAPLLPAQTDYPLTADSERQAGVPSGTVTKHTWTSTIFPGTVRDYWVYVPAQYTKDVPAAVMVFQDGGGYVDEKGRWRAPIVFRQPDPQGRDAGDDRRLRQSRRAALAFPGPAVAVQPQLRVRRPG